MTDPKASSLGTIAIVIGLILMGVAIGRMLSGPATSEVAVLPPPSVQVAKPLPVEPPEPERQIEEYVNPEHDAALELQEVTPSQVDESPSVAIDPSDTHLEAISQGPAPALRTFYAQVIGADGTMQTLSLSAANEDAARVVIERFRGDPQIIHGPALSVDW